MLAAFRPRGLPIGNLTSQFWANVYLNPFDHFVKRELRCRGYVRYVDDFLLFSESKSTAWEWKAAITERLARYRLSLHAGIHPRPVTEGIGFLGFTIFPKRRRLKQRKGIHFRRRLKGLVAACEAGALPLEKLHASIQGWVNHVRYGDTLGLRRSILNRLALRLPKQGPKSDPLDQCR
jgi:hypothetical protein